MMLSNILYWPVQPKRRQSATILQVRYSQLFGVVHAPDEALDGIVNARPLTMSKGLASRGWKGEKVKNLVTSDPIDLLPKPTVVT